MITTPQDYKHFSSDAGNHGKPRNMNLGWFVGQVLGQCLGFQNGEDWVRVKAMFNPPFTHSAAVARISMVNSAAESYVKQLPKLAVTSDKSVANSFTVSVEEAFTKFPYFVTAKVIYGTMTKSEEDDLWHLTEKRIALNPYLFGGGPYRSAIASRIFDRDAVSELTAFNSEWQKYNAQMAQKRRTWREKPPIVTYWEEYEKGNMTLAEVSVSKQCTPWICVDSGFLALADGRRISHAQPRRNQSRTDFVDYIGSWPRQCQTGVM